MMNSVKDWRSTLAGIALVITGAVQVHGAGDLSNGNVISNILGGVSLILAQFPKKAAAAK
jgi:hypothetical protein